MYGTNFELWLFGNPDNFFKLMEEWLEHRQMKKRKTNRAKRVDHTCRNHGSCAYCKRGRLYQAIKEEEKAEDKIKEYEEENEQGN